MAVEASVSPFLFRNAKRQKCTRRRVENELNCLAAANDELAHW